MPPNTSSTEKLPGFDQETLFEADRARRARLARYNPIKGLEPAKLARYMDQFESGYLSDFALLMDKIERRDDILVTVAQKRKADAARVPWQIIIRSDLDEGQQKEAQRHKDALEYFYNNLTATDALDLNVCGGFRMLAKQMLDAVGKTYAAHEIIWKQTPEGITAQFNFVPLWFFENTTGRLRFIEKDYALHGVDCPSGEWMITVGAGIMEACAVAYMFKHLPLKDWLIYSQDFGRPIIEGITDALKDSSEWEAMVDAVEAVSSDLRVVHNRNGELKITFVGNAGNLPQPGLVERMDRALSAIWRGADLSTMSAGSGQGDGASLQGEEGDILHEDDLAMLTDTLQQQVDRWVIELQFGAGIKPLAYIEIKPPPSVDVSREIETDRFLVDSGVPLGVADTLERYGRTKPDPEDEIITKPVPPPSPFAPNYAPAPAELANVHEPGHATATLQQNIRTAFAKSIARDLAPVRMRLDSILRIQAPDIFERKLKEFLVELPQLVRDINADPDAARILEESMVAALANGLESPLKKS